MKPPYIPNLFKPISIELSLINTLEEQLRTAADDNPVAQKLLQSLYRFQTENNNETFTQWLVRKNTALVDAFEENEGKPWMKNAHEILADLLWKIYTGSRITNTTKEVSKFARDALLKQVYGFNSYPWIIKHALPLSNPLLLKGLYYADDETFDRCSSVNEKSSTEIHEQEPILLADVAILETNYKKDKDFQDIVKAHKGLDLGFVGVSTTKGGLIAFLHIILEQEGNFRFVGSLDPNLDRNDSAYNHGPFFIAIKGSMSERPKLNGVYDLTLAEMQFLLPDLESCNNLKAKLTSLSESGLLKVDLNIVFAQIFTYAEFRQTISLTDETQNHLESVTDAEELSSPVTPYIV